MKCVRCLHDTADVIAKAPDGSELNRKKRTIDKMPPHVG